MPTKTALKRIEKLQLLAENYSENFNKEIPDTKNFSPEYVLELKSQNNLSLKKKILSDVASIQNDIVLHNRELETKKNEKLFPLLNGSIDIYQSRGEQQVTNANLVFQMNYLNGNPDYIIEQLKLAMNDDTRRDYFSTLLNQTLNFPVKDEPQMKVLDEAKKIKAEFDEKTGLTNINEAKNINSYGSKLSEITSKLVDNDYGGFSLPDYLGLDFDSKVELGKLSLASGVDVSEFTATQSEPALT